jgi:alcohol dehydrogenase
MSATSRNAPGSISMTSSNVGLRPFDMHWPTRIVFGPDTLERLGSLTRENDGTRTLLVSDPGVSAAGHASRAAKLLEAAGIQVFSFDAIDENPTTRHVDRATEFAREVGIDSIVGIGGGSAIDVAKGVNFLITNGGSMEDYWGEGKATKPMLPMIAVPTTAGTGTETQSFALIVNAETRQKMACGDKKAMCRAVILDPLLTLTMPQRVTAASGIDAISHVVESWVSSRGIPISRMFCGQAWACMVGSFDTVAESPKDLEARSNMLLGAALAGAAIENSMLGIAHSCANPLTARYNTVHGVAVGLMLPHVIRFNAVECDAAYAELMIRGGLPYATGAPAGEFLADWIAARLQTHGLPQRLSEVGVDRSALPELAGMASMQWTAQFNPRRADVADLEGLYELAF